MIDMEFLIFYIGLKVTQDWKKKTIKLFENGYIEKYLDCHDIPKTNTTKMSMQETTLLLLDTHISNLEKVKYSTKVCFIIYVMVVT